MSASIDRHARAAALRLNGRAFIGGRYGPAATGAAFDSVASAPCSRPSPRAISIGNDTVYGLAAAVGTRNISSPFGGFKQSGFGRGKSLHGSRNTPS